VPSTRAGPPNDGSVISPRTKKLENFIQRIKNFKYDHLKNYYNALNNLPPNAPIESFRDQHSGKSPMEMITGINFYKDKETAKHSPFPKLPPQTSNVNSGVSPL
jgi:hypothetical protein